MVDAPVYVLAKTSPPGFCLANSISSFTELDGTLEWTVRERDPYSSGQRGKGLGRIVRYFLECGLYGMTDGKDEQSITVWR